MDTDPDDRTDLHPRPLERAHAPPRRSAPGRPAGCLRWRLRRLRGSAAARAAGASRATDTPARSAAGRRPQLLDGRSERLGLREHAGLLPVLRPGTARRPGRPSPPPASSSGRSASRSATRSPSSRRARRHRWKSRRGASSVSVISGANTSTARCASSASSETAPSTGRHRARRHRHRDRRATRVRGVRRRGVLRYGGVRHAGGTGGGAVALPRPRHRRALRAPDGRHRVRDRHGAPRRLVHQRGL